MNKKYYSNRLTPITSKIKTFDFVGFDVETYNVNGVQTFYFGSIYYYKNNKPIFETYFDKNELIERLLSKAFKGYYIVATNLGFDYSSLFYGSKYWNRIKLIWRGSDLLACKYALPNKKGSIMFIDTFNYVGFSVEKLGEIINIPKMRKPDYIGKRKSKNNEELKYFIEYNKYDCKITCDFMYFLQKGLNDLGGQLKITIASSSLDLFRRKFQTRVFVKEELKITSFDVKNFIFKGYYGGRTEVFKRGEFSKLNYYDVNSLYPAMMLKALPNPNTVFIPNTFNINNIQNYMGVSDVHVTAPDMDYPILPHKTKDKKLIFPVGNFRGVFNHNELAYAIEHGYKINKIYNQLCYMGSFTPFRSFCTELYRVRREYQKHNNPMQLVTKLCLNSLYGKFAQKERKEIDLINFKDLTQEELKHILLYDDDYDIKNDYAIKTSTKQFNGCFSFPILSSYICSHARVHMHKLIKDNNAYYMDTDSLITTNEIDTSTELGGLKLEMTIKKAILIKPKFYYLNNGVEEIIKMKGINRASLKDFNNAMNNQEIQKTKFSKIRESIRRGFTPNEEIVVKKLLNLNDNKRVWDYNNSTPIKLNEIT